MFFNEDKIKVKLNMLLKVPLKRYTLNTFKPLH